MSLTIQEAEAIVRANLSKQIKDNLELNELKGAGLAALCGVDRFHCYKWINGKTIPSLQAALAIATALGTTIDELVNPHG